jgi:cation diffusion facilitator CzcD-associated flavoprotein CzcO
MTTSPDAVVIGAGPYGLAASAQLRHEGMAVRTFGVPMSFWMRHMPKGMFLRSPWDASHIGDPSAAPTLDEFERERRAAIARPIPLDDFVSYGTWVQTQAVPDAEDRTVAAVVPTSAGLRVSLDDGEQIETPRVVVAVGIARYAWRPEAFAHLPAPLASHSSDHPDLGVFAGRRVVVLGAGQSALESAALLHEGGAEVEVVVRARRLRWVGRATRDGAIGRVLFDRTDVGPALVSHVVAHPTFFRRLRPSVQASMSRRSLVAGGATWLRERLRPVKFTLGRHVIGATPANGELRLRLDDDTVRTVDHLLLATGYRVDLSRSEFLSPAVLRGVRCVDGYPVLDDGFQSTVPGLHFIGATAVGSFGPLVRFVSGTRFTATTLARGMTGRPLTRAVRPRAAAAPALADSREVLVAEERSVTR